MKSESRRAAFSISAEEFNFVSSFDPILGNKQDINTLCGHCHIGLLKRPGGANKLRIHVICPDRIIM